MHSQVPTSGPRALQSLPYKKSGLTHQPISVNATWHISDMTLHHFRDVA